MPSQAQRIKIEADPQSALEALTTAEGWSGRFTPEVTGDFTEGPAMPATTSAAMPRRRQTGRRQRPRFQLANEAETPCHHTRARSDGARAAALPPPSTSQLDD